MERKIRGAFAFALTCLVVIGTVSWMAVDRLRANAARVEHTHEVISRLEALLAATTDVETGHRGFIITGDERYLEPHRLALDAADGELQILREMTVDNPAQQVRLRGLATTVGERLKMSQALVELRRTGGFEAAVGQVLTGQGKVLHDRVRGQIREMTGVERTLLQQRELRTQRSAGTARIVILSGGILAFGFVGFAIVAIGRDFSGRRAAERALREVNEQLELRVVQRTSELERALESLRDNERLLQETGELAKVGGWSFDPATGEGLWTDEVARIHGLDPTTATNKDLGLRFYPGESRQRIEAAVKAAVDNGEPYDLELEFISARGEHKWVRTICRPLLEDGKVMRVRGAFQDITARKQAETKLRTQLARLDLLSRITRAVGERQDTRSIFQVVVRTVEEQLPLDFCCICLYEPARNELTVSSVGVRSADLALELAMTEQARVAIDENGLSLCVRGQLVYEPDLAAVAFPFPQRLYRGGLQSLVAAPLVVENRVFGVLVAARREARAFGSDDCEFLRQLSEHVALAAHQAQLYGALQAAHEDRRLTQQAVMQQERLRSLGQMASGIAHDINNAISPVTLYTESLLEQEPDLSDRARDYLQTIQRAIDDVAQTVSRMRQFYRQREQEQALTPVDLNELVSQVIGLTRARWSDMAHQRGVSIELHTGLMPQLPAIRGAESEIREALTNLIFNAVDAMPEDGTLTLRTRLLPDRPPVVAQRRVCVEVVDTGSGMDEATRRRCLEPFFTTKGERGTGLGLAMVYGVVERHNAELQIDSVAGSGTTMRLCFPLPGETATDAPSSTRPDTTGVPVPLRILIVDDDPLLLRSLGDILRADGHDITAGNGGQDGIDAFGAAQERGQPFNIVISDLGMPHVDGRKVAAAIKAMAPAVPIILLTGWGQRMAAEGDVPPGVDRVLAKPPKMQLLRTALAELTGQAKAV